MKLGRLMATFVLIALPAVLACSSLAGVKGKFSEPVRGKALSIVVRRVSDGGLMLEISNPSSEKITITPLKLKVIDDSGSETDTSYELKRKSSQEIDIAGGSILSGTLAVANPNLNQPPQPGSPAALSQGEKIVFNPGPGKGIQEKVQVSIGPEGANTQEVFAITK